MGSGEGARQHWPKEDTCASKAWEQQGRSLGNAGVGIISVYQMGNLQARTAGEEA